MTDDVPLICDRVPGPLRVPSWAHDVLVRWASGPDRGQTEWIDMVPGPPPKRSQDWPIYSPPQWPDAEFCAA